MWRTAWGSRLSPRSPNCLNLNLRSFLCCSTNYPCTQLCGVSARRFGSIVPEHPLVGLRWKYLLAWTFFYFIFYFYQITCGQRSRGTDFLHASCSKWLADINSNCDNICWYYCIVFLSLHHYLSSIQPHVRGRMSKTFSYLRGNV